MGGTDLNTKAQACYSALIPGDSGELNRLSKKAVAQKGGLGRIGTHEALFQKKVEMHTGRLALLDKLRDAQRNQATPEEIDRIKQQIARTKREIVKIEGGEEKCNNKFPHKTDNYFD